MASPIIYDPVSGSKTVRPILASDNAIGSGVIRSGNIGDNAVTSGNVASGQITSEHLASGVSVTISRKTIDASLTTAEPVSGGYAVTVNASGNAINYQPSAGSGKVSIGVAVANAASGTIVSVQKDGLFTLAAFNFSGQFGKNAFAGSGGMVVSELNIPQLSGNFQSKMGTIINVTTIDVQPEPQTYQV